MTYLNRIWAAATVAVVNSHADQGGQKLKSGLRSLHHGKRRFSSSDVRPISSVAGSDLAGVLSCGNGDEVRQQADESFRQVMYSNCWGPS